MINLYLAVVITLNLYLIVVSIIIVTTLREISLDVKENKIRLSRLGVEVDSLVDKEYPREF